MLEILNKGAADTTGSFSVDAGTARSSAKTFVTKAINSLNETDSVVIGDPAGHIAACLILTTPSCAGPGNWQRVSRAHADHSVAG